MIPLIAIRPEPGCAATIAAARALGLEAHGFPLFTVAPVAWNAPAPQGIDALLIGSGNAVRHGGSALTALQDVPVYAVGQTTATVCSAAGLVVAGVGSGSLQAVLGKVDPAHRRLLRLSGSERVELTPPPGVTITERTVYASTPLAMPPELAALLRHPCVVMLHSAQAARHFATECNAQGIDRSVLHLAAIGPRVSAVAGSGWAEVANADTPAEAPLLALANRLCQDGSGPQQDR